MYTTLLNSPDDVLQVWANYDDENICRIICTSIIINNKFRPLHTLKQIMRNRTVERNIKNGEKESLKKKKKKENMKIKERKKERKKDEMMMRQIFIFDRSARARERDRGDIFYLCFSLKSFLPVFHSTRPCVQASVTKTFGKQAFKKSTE